MVAIFCQRMHEGKTPVVYGDGEQTRDFIYVGDVVGAIVSALLAEEPLAQRSGDGASYNVSTGLETSVNKLLAALRLASGYLGGVEQAPAREGDVLRSSLYPRKAAKVFWWGAHQTLELGAEMTWRWYASQA